MSSGRGPDRVFGSDRERGICRSCERKFCIWCAGCEVRLSAPAREPLKITRALSRNYPGRARGKTLAHSYCSTSYSSVQMSNSSG